jgi:hypothetical protein
VKISCPCGNVLRDQSDFIPYKAYFVADQDYIDLVEQIETGSDPYEIMRKLHREMFQCINCGRVCIEDPNDPREIQWFAPEDANWKKSLVSVNGEASKPWRGSLVGHWDPSRPIGRLWFDPPANQTGGFEVFKTLDQLQARYSELLEEFKAMPGFRGARLGYGSEGDPITDVHSWSPARG